MTKRKIMLVALSLCMVAILAMGGTLAYLTDDEQATNKFTVGNIDIKLIEEFDPNNAVLLPGSKTENAINKDVWVENTGDNDAWVRVIISIPAHLDVLAVEPENYEEIAAKNVLHMNTVAGVETIWNVQKANWEAKLSEDNKYNEYTFYYYEPLTSGAKTEQLLDQVYLDAKVDYDHENETYTYKGEAVDLNDIQILVRAEAIQADGFDTYAEAFAAFDAQFAANNADGE